VPKEILSNIEAVNKIYADRQKINNQNLNKQIEITSLKKKKIEEDIALQGTIYNQKQKLELEKYKTQIEWLKARKELGILAEEFIHLDLE
jgi:hypothetical protein